MSNHFIAFSCGIHLRYYINISGNTIVYHIPNEWRHLICGKDGCIRKGKYRLESK